MEKAPTVGILWRSRPQEPPPPREENRLAAIFEGFEAAGASVVPIPFSEEAQAEVRAALSELDALLTWVDPIVAGRDRSLLDSMLREASDSGVYVWAHPDVILKLGTKDVLVKTSGASWGSATFVLETPEACYRDLPSRLRQGSRVLKQYRGSSGDGVWKVDAEGDAPDGIQMPITVRHALRGSREEHTTLGEFIQRSTGYFAAFSGAGHLIDQPYLSRVGEGMTRAYMAGDRVAGFGHQLVTALAPLPPGCDETPTPPPRYYFGADQPEFQRLRHNLESGWLSELTSICGVRTSDLPAIWDADFLLGPKDARGEDTYVLCEVNVSGVFPIPDEAIVPLVRWTFSRVEARRLG